MANLKIGIDVDYTLFSCDSLLYKYIARLKTSSNDKKLKYCEISKTQNYKVGLFCKMIKAFNPKFYKEYHNASKIIKLLKQNGHEIYIITSRPSFQPFVGSLQSWLNDNQIEYDKLIMGCSNKSNFAYLNGLDLMIDDLEHNCKAMENIGIKSLLFKGDNYAIEDCFDLDIAHSWTSVYAKIQKFVQERGI